MKLLNKSVSATQILIAIAVLLVAAFGLYKFVFSTDDNSAINDEPTSVDIPGFLVSAFPDTDWSQVDPSISMALSGGPGKDGIPAIDDPKFEPLNNFKHPNSIQAIVINDSGSAKVYPYNILVWHEIVNDTADGVPIAVTFCPLCGSAVVYNRTLPDGPTTFGVSGALLESNMIMYDRASETLWQQSTSKALAGKYFGHNLELIKFQLLTIGEAKAKYPDGLVLSENTGHSRDYARNPYSGYEESEDFFFSPSINDQRYPPKSIFVAFTVNDTPVSAPWLDLKDGKTYQTKAGGQTVTLKKQDNELSIIDADDQEIPFYFEMWFSWAVQHQDEGIVFDPNN